MKKYIPYILVIVATLALVWVLRPFESKVDVDSYLDKINALEQKVDSLHAKNDALVIEADSLTLKLSEYDVKIQELNYNINVIKYETKQKLDAVDLFGDDELERFFAERYRQYKDSVN